MDPFFFFFSDPTPTPTPVSFFANPYKWVSYEAYVVETTLIKTVLSWAMMLFMIRQVPGIGPLVMSTIERALLYCIGHRKQIATELIDLTGDVAEVAEDLVEEVMKHVTPITPSTPLGEFEEESKSADANKNGKSKNA